MELTKYLYAGMYDPRPVSILEGYQVYFTPVKYVPKEGSTIEYKSGTVVSKK